MGYVNKEFFANYFLHMSDVTFHMRTDSMSLDRRFTKKCQALEGAPWWIPRADSKSQLGLGTGRLIALTNSALMSCLTACRPSRID